MQNESFDPYQQWLGISSGSQPPNFYELLGLEKYDSDESRIRSAVASRTAILQMVTGDEANRAEEILKEVAEAEACLLDPASKSSYDLELKNGHDNSENSAGENAQANKPDRDLNTNGNSLDSLPALPKFGGPPIPESQNVKLDLEGTPDEMQSRIKSQKIKEQQDQKFKVILDRVMWGSCGVCIIAIAWVMIARVSGCNQDPTTIAEKKESDKPSKEKKINSKKLSPQKKLDRSLMSPLEKEDRKKKMQVKSRENTSTNKKNNKSTGGGDFSAGNNSNAEPKFESIKETIGFFSFNQPVNKNDLLDGLAPLRLRKVKWSRKQSGGYITLDKSSQVEVDSENAFDRIKKLTLLARFKTSGAKRKQCLLSIKGKILVVIDQGQLQVTGKGGTLKSDSKVKLGDGKWHEFAVSIGKQSRLWLDGEFIAEGNITLPELAGSKTVSEIGKLTGSNDSNFVGQLDTIGFYWIELDERQIRSQFAN